MMRRTLLLFICLFMSLACFAAESVRLTNMRVQPSLTMTRFSFLLSGKTCGTLKYLPNPDRVLIDIEKTTKDFNIQNVRLGGSNVLTMNADEVDKGTLRFTLMTQGKVRWNIQILPYGTKGNVVLQVDIISVSNPGTKTPVTHEKFSRLKKINDFIAHDFQAAFSKMKNTYKKQLADHEKKTLAAVKQPHIFTVVIDAGHGGKDTGARGANGKEEKTIVLSIATKLAEKINQQPNMRAVLTRTGDYFLPLRERMNIARQKHGDVFIAVHADAYLTDSASGASVYALSQHGATTEAARWLAKKDNYSELGGVELNALQDKSPMLRSVLIDLSQTATIKDSLRLGNKVLSHLDDVSALHIKHVEQAPFMVLKAPDMPSILIETGFISNPSEEQRLTDAGYQDQLAQAIYLGVDRYRRQYAALGE